MASSWDAANNFRRDATKSFNQSEAYHSQATAIKNSSAAINANYNQQFVEWLSEQSADNTGGGHIGIQGAAHIIGHDPELAVKYAERFVEERNLLPPVTSKIQITSPKNLKAKYDQENNHAFIDLTKDNAQSGMDVIRNIGKKAGLVGVTDNKLEENFNHKQLQAKGELNLSKQKRSSEYNNKSSKHQDHADEIDNDIKRIFDGESQTK